MSEQTQGPWSVAQASWDEETGDVRYTLDGVKTARAGDARLIAAAPTMYAYIEQRASDGDEVAKRLLESIHAGR